MKKQSQTSRLIFNVQSFQMQQNFSQSESKWLLMLILSCTSVGAKKIHTHQQLVTQADTFDCVEWLIPVQIFPLSAVCVLQIRQVDSKELPFLF